MFVAMCFWGRVPRIDKKGGGGGGGGGGEGGILHIIHSMCITIMLQKAVICSRCLYRCCNASKKLSKALIFFLLLERLSLTTMDCVW